MYVWAYQQQATSHFHLQACDSPPHHRNQKPTRDPHFPGSTTPTPICTLHPLSPLPRQVSPMRHQQCPSHSTLKSARGSQLSLTVRENGRHPEDQTFEMYKVVRGELVLAGRRPCWQSFPCLFIPNPLHIMRPSVSFLPRTHLRGRSAPFQVLQCDPPCDPPCDPTSHEQRSLCHGEPITHCPAGPCPGHSC